MIQTLTIVAVGDGAVGKTCMYIRYAVGLYPTDWVPTVFENHNATIMCNGQRYSLGLCDTAGGEEYDRLRPLSYSQANLFLVCFSVVSPCSFHNVRTKWHPEISRYCAGIPFILVGTKRDLRSDPDLLGNLAEHGAAPVSFEMASEMAQELHASAYIEISSFTGDHVQDLFKCAIKIAATGTTGIPQSKRKKSVSWFSWGTLWNAVVPHIVTSRPPLLSNHVFGMLPHELWMNIFSFCDPKDLFRISAVCRDFRALASTDGLWTRFIPTSIISSSSSKGAPLKSLFISSGAFYLYRRGVDWCVCLHSPSTLTLAKRIFIP